MAMSGVRTLTTNAGLLKQAPPEAIMSRYGPDPDRVSLTDRTVFTELAHWMYGALGGAAYGLLPSPVRARPWSGPVYGVVVWAGFEMAFAPALGVQNAQGRSVVGRFVLALDHVLYGAVVGGAVAPEQAREGRR